MKQPPSMHEWCNRPDAPPSQMAKPTASAPLTKLADAELHHVIMWLANHTAVGRAALGEIEAAFERLEREAGFILVKKDEANG